MNFLKLFRIKTVYILLVIVFVAAFLRFNQLGQNPPSLTWDEVAWGYNAYSLGLNGKDEFGRFLPLDYIESFGDFKPTVYAYLDILPIKVFGLNEFATRVPSAFFGALTVLVTYFLVLRIFGNRRTTQNHTQNYTEIIALISSFLLAVSPWHINLSRAAFEANVATFFIIAGVWMFFAGMQGKRWYLIFSTVFFVLSIYTFNTARIVSPILVLVLSLGFYKQIINRKKEVIISLIIGIILLLPILRFLITPQASLRFKEVNIFSNIGIIIRTNMEMENDKNVFWTRLLHNRRLAYGVEYLRHYFDNLNPNFLFIRGDGNPKFSTQDVGQLYIWEIPFLIAGILYLLRKKEGHWWIVPLWLIIGIIPAATARETPHSLRIESTLPAFQIFVAYGLVQFFQKISKIKYQISKIQIKYLIFTMFFSFSILNLLYYLHGYYVHYAREYSAPWQYGYKEAISYINSVEDKYDKIYFTKDLGRPYIYFLFYTKYEPEKFRQEAKINREVYGFVHVNSFGKYSFDDRINNSYALKEKLLFVEVPKKVPENAKIEKIFYLLNGEAALVAYTL